MVVPAMAAVFAAAFPVANAGFENGMDSWQSVGVTSCWNSVEGAGRPRGVSQPPTRGLVFTRREGDKASRYVWQEVPVSPGDVLKVSVWARAEELVSPNKPPKIAVGVGGPGVVSVWSGSNPYGDFDERDIDGWHLLQLTTPPVAGGASRMQICICVDADAVGKAVFDDVKVELAESRIVDRFCCNAVGRAAVRGQITFSAQVVVNETLHPIKTIRAYLEIGGCRKPMRFLPSGKMVELTVPVEDFAIGPNLVRLVVETDDGVVLGDGCMSFERQMPECKPIMRKVMFDDSRRLLLDGVATFPLGIFWHPDESGDEQAFSKLRESPFNYVISYDKDMTRSAMDKLAATGKRVMVNVGSAYVMHDVLMYDRLPSPGITNASAAEAFVRRKVAELKDHPALMGWYVCDEFPSGAVPKVYERCQLLRQLDPDHITGCILWNTKDIREFSQCADFTGVDRYPVGHLNSTEAEKSQPPMRNVYDALQECLEQTRERRPLWQCLQAFSWHADYPQEKYSWMRFPTAEEYLSETWQNIAGGADGLVYFIFRSVYREWKKGNRAPYDDLMRVVLDVKRLSPVILSKEQPPRVAGADKDLVVRAIRYGGRLYVIACNLTWRQMNRTLDMEGEWEDPVTEVGSSASLLSPQKLAIALPPIGVSVIRLENAMRCAPGKIRAITTLPHELDALLEGGHVQGADCDATGIYLSHSRGIVKIDWQGRKLAECRARDHLGDCGVWDGKLYGITALRMPRKQGEPQRSEGWLSAWDAKTLALLKERKQPEPGDGLTVMDGVIHYGVDRWGQGGETGNPRALIARAGLDLEWRDVTEIDLGFNILWGVQTLATDGKELLSASYALRDGRNARGSAMARCTKDLSPVGTINSFVRCSEGFGRVSDAVFPGHKHPVFFIVRALGGNYKSWRKNPTENPPRVEIVFAEYHDGCFYDITETAQ